MAGNFHKMFFSLSFLVFVFVSRCGWLLFCFNQLGSNHQSIISLEQCTSVRLGTHTTFKQQCGSHIEAGVV